MEIDIKYKGPSYTLKYGEGQEVDWDDKYVCKLCNNTYQSLGKHLIKGCDVNPKWYYDVFLRYKYYGTEHPKCLCCGAPLTQFKGFKYFPNCYGIFCTPSCQGRYEMYKRWENLFEESCKISLASVLKDSSDKLFYLIEFDSFIKIGVVNSENIFWYFQRNYNLENLSEIKFWQGTSREICYLEYHLKLIFKNSLYKPEERSVGWTERFILESKSKLLKLINARVKPIQIY